MCIRDREDAAQQVATARENSAKEVAAAKQQAIEAITLAKSCLLYTSDAADERSSVDLGGRRIIKKKIK